MTGASLRLSLDVTAVPADPVGAGRYTVDLVTALAARPDVDLTLWSRTGDVARWEGWAGPSGSVRAAAPERRPLRLVWEQVRLPGLLRGAGVDVHHGPHYTMPERGRVPAVVTIHDLTFLDHPEWHERSKVPVFRRAIKVAARRATALVCVSDQTAWRFEELCRPLGRVFVVPHGVDHGRFRPEEPDAGSDRRLLDGLGVRSPYILFLGTLEPRKAVPELVAAFDRIAGEEAELTLVLAGRPGWGRAEVERAVGVARHRDRVIATGYVPDAAVPALLRGAVVVAYPALEEGFGLPALEALACGAPLVTTAGTVMADLAGSAALLAAPGSVDGLVTALRSALAGSPGADDRRREGLAVAARHSWEASAEGHLAAYRWAAEAARAAPP